MHARSNQDLKALRKAGRRAFMATSNFSLRVVDFHFFSLPIYPERETICIFILNACPIATAEIEQHAEEAITGWSKNNKTDQREILYKLSVFYLFQRQFDVFFLFYNFWLAFILWIMQNVVFSDLKSAFKTPNNKQSNQNHDEFIRILYKLKKNEISHRQ